MSATSEEPSAVGEHDIVTGLTSQNGRPIVIVGVPTDRLDLDAIQVVSVQFPQFPGVDLSKAELLLVFGPTQASILEALAPKIGPDTEITVNGKRAASA